MRQTLQMMRTELRQLFYSPVAWILLVVFILQTGIPFLETFRQGLKMMVLDSPFWRATDQLYAGGLMETVQHSIYLYLPLLTMGLLSNEYSSGSIKLLYSSPVKSVQIIIGKYLSVVCYGGVLLLVLLSFVTLGILRVPNLSYPVIASALLAFILLFMAYAAIGLFISCLTEYQVVSAVATFALFAVLNYVGELGQGIPVLRDICYWLCLPYHSGNMIHGLICSADVIYFLLIIVGFLTLSVLVLNRRKSEVSRGRMWACAVAVVAVVMTIGVLSSRPAARLYADVTETKYMTLSSLSQQVLAPLRSEKVQITTYVNIADESFSKLYAVPRQMLADEARFDPYRRFLPYLKMRYVYYYKNLFQTGDDEDDLMKKALDAMHMSKQQLTPLEKIDCLDELSAQGWQMTRTVEACGRKSFLNMFSDPMMLPGEAEITAALSIVAGQGVPVWMAGDNKEAYGATITSPHNRQALCNQGFIVSEATPAAGDSCRLAIILNPRKEMDDEQKNTFSHLIAKGNSALVIADAENAAYVNDLLQPLGVSMTAEELRQHDPNYDGYLIQGALTQEAIHLLPQLAAMTVGIATMPHCGTLSFGDTKTFKVTPLLTDKESGRMVACLLTRQVGSHEQRVAVFANAAFMSNRELGNQYNGITAINQPFAQQLLYWMGGDGSYPLQIVYPQPTDMQITGEYESIYTLRWLYMGILPIVVAIIGATVIIIRKRK
ncbi:MAG: Gldg family protein [Prevotella sp.]|nr:Gldg family protein [Prevotella sp.]MBR1464357.1 Gldg family protein [Prevotella sp.]